MRYLGMASSVALGVIAIVAVLLLVTAPLVANHQTFAYYYHGNIIGTITMENISITVFRLMLLATTVMAPMSTVVLVGEQHKRQKRAVYEIFKARGKKKEDNNTCSMLFSSIIFPRSLSYPGHFDGTNLDNFGFPDSTITTAVPVSLLC